MREVLGFMNRPTRGAMRQAILACVGALCVLAQTAVADFTPTTFSVSTLSESAPYYDTDSSGYVSTSMFGSYWRSLVGMPGSPLPYIAVGFALPGPTDPIVTGAVVDSLTVPFFVDEDTAGISMRFRLVNDMTLVSPDLTAPNMSSVVATFVSPSDWPSIAEVTPDGSVLSSLSRQWSGTLLYGRSYWLVVDQVDTLDGTAHANWYFSEIET
ncbi:MAG: hypothetical protein GX595_15180 [Lentisphaerae bacterium]|nr:hypothetical protein [Lentisphaerota bacterium]